MPVKKRRFVGAKRRAKVAKARATQDSRLALQPKLRLIVNGSATVNVLRAEQASALAVTDAAGMKLERTGALKISIAKGRPPKPKLRRGNGASNVQANVFIDYREHIATKLPRGGPITMTRERGRQMVARVKVSDLESVATDPEVLSIELAEALVDPTPTVDPAVPKAPVRRKLGPAALHKDGEGVLIGIIDVQGFDFAHQDFLDRQGRTRFVAIWDQGGSNRPSPKEFDYGSVLTSEHMNRAIAASRGPNGAPATQLEPQSQMVVGSHGTHVASIAAGNSGVCSKADIAAVLISMGPEDLDIRKCFYDSSRIIHAVEYLVGLAGKRPLSINVSLGTNGHAHDGSSGASRWLDALLTTPGKALCVAAGNAGQERPEFEGDLGYLIGRIHTSGRIASRGLTRDIGWLVVGNGRADMSENELELWYSAQDRFSVAVRSPDGEWTAEVLPGQYIENRPLGNGTFISVYNELYHATNGSNYIAIYLSPPLVKGQATRGVAAGQWNVRLRGLDVRDGNYHGWIERDDPRPIGTQGGQELWNFPSSFDEGSNVDKSSVSSLACGNNVVAVANLDEKKERLNITSSQGPTRDGRAKPDICAPGTDIVAAKGFAGPSDPWISMTGTSMASPYVAGVIGLMLATKPTLNAAQILGLLRRTAQPLAGSDYVWRDDAGYGAITPGVAIEAAKTFADRKDVT